MSAKASHLSKRRMQARDHFISLTPGYLTVENKTTKLPEIDIRISGLPSHAWLAEDVIAVLEAHFRHNPQRQLMVRKTA